MCQYMTGAAARLTLALAAVILTLTLRAGRALAVATAKKAPSAVSTLLTGDTLKWAGLCGVLGAMYMFRTEETPILY